MLLGAIPTLVAEGKASNTWQHGPDIESIVVS